MRPELKLEFLMDLDVEVGEVVSMGSGPLGERRVVPILGGTFNGPEMSGDVLAGGADWQIARADGALELDARYVLRVKDGGMIAVRSQGLRRAPPEVMAQLSRGEDVEASLYYFRTAMRFDTGAPAFAWLNATIAIATARRKARRVELKAWRVL